MSNEQTTSPKAAPSATVAWVLSIYLIGTFLWRMLTPAHEYAMRSEQLMEIGLDVLCVICLFGMKAKLPQAVFWIALVAGIGLLLIRTHSDASWWTGHWNYSLLPR